MTKARTSVLAFACVLTALVLVAVVAIPQAGAARAHRLGKTAHTPSPACPGDPCAVIGSVTGIQVKADGEKHLMRMPQDGKIVAWSVDLSNPKDSERKFFAGLFGNDKFGNDPAARISVLKKIDGKHYKLTAQSRPIDLSGYFGQTPIITLNKPLRAAQGRFVAITTPTWLPNLVVSGAGAGDSAWRASRRSGKCGTHAAKTKARPQQDVGSVREYGCRFTDRLLYWAYWVPR